MNGFLKKAGLGVALAATALTAAAPADAQRWGRGGYGRGYGGYHRGGNAAGAAVLGGILGLGVGAAIASSNNRNRGYYDDGYYRGPPPRAYYNAPVRTYYREDYRPRCWNEWRVDPYYGDRVSVQVCS
ncbi:hypothetical protein [Sphingomonas sp. R86520]|uniref:hypothetical protein n=1 Tax=Sphingomonas sp. R86520 TaxID=3093859 RepID=UPI0036D3EF38